MSDESDSGFKVRDLRGQTKEEPAAKESPVQNKPKDQPIEETEVQITFSNFVLSMTTSALIHMGLLEDPQTKKKEKNLPVARQEVDILGMLEEKTRGNLDPKEKELIQAALYDLRTQFVQANR